MKKLFTLFLILFLILPGKTLAHTHLISSIPAEGEVVIEERKEIILTFDGTIEKLSTMNLTRDGAEVSGLQVQIEADMMIGTFSESLQSGQYIIDWSISGEDGHPITGQIHFAVEKEEIIENQENSNDSNILTNNQDDPKELSQSAEVEEVTGIQSTNDSLSQKERSQTSILPILLGFFIVLGTGLLLVRRKG
nr:copper resistance CopC family protein [Neobacillus sp. Marseille-Q6967]